jgi:hypothetical protein
LPTWAGGDDHAVGWVDDRLVLLVPAHAVMLVALAAKYLEDLSPARRLAVHSTGLNPITRPGAGVKRCSGHLFTSFDAIKPLRPEVAIGGQREAGCGDLPMTV